MEDYPKTILELERRFATEDACREYFISFAGRMDSFVSDVKIPLPVRFAGPLSLPSVSSPNFGDRWRNI